MNGKCGIKASSLVPCIIVGALAVIGALSITDRGKRMLSSAADKVRRGATFIKDKMD